jgi:hypothetical protein
MRFFIGYWILKMGWISILALFLFIDYSTLILRTINYYNMKKISVIVLGVISIFFSQDVFSQSHSSSHGTTNPMQIGDLFVNVGIGFGAGYKNPTYNTPWGFKVAAEYGMWQAGPGVITIGPEIGGTFSGQHLDGDSYISSTFVVAGRAAWHNGWDVPGLDTYAGFSAGIGFNHYTYPGTDYNSPIPYIGAFVGGSYFVTPSFGFNTEFGYDITSFQIGVVFKLQ